MRDRRTFIRAIGGGLLAAPLALLARPRMKLWRIGYLTPVRRVTHTTLLAQLTDALRELGYVDGQTARFEVRSADEDIQRLPALATELVHANVDVIVAVSPYAIRAASQATKTTPIVMAFWGGEGLMESGMVASFARPRGNVTGVYMLADELEGKRLEMLVEAVPRARRIAVISTAPGDAPVQEVRQAATAARLVLVMTQVPAPNGYDPVFKQ